MSVVISSRALIINPENKLLLVTHEDTDFYYTPGGKSEIIAKYLSPEEVKNLSN